MATISWRAPEYIHTEKTSDWYWIVGIVALSAALIAWLLGDAVFGVFIIVASLTLALYASRPAPMVNMSVSDKGVTIGNLFYAYSNLDSFWLDEHEMYPRIIFKTSKRILPHFVMLIEDTDPVAINELLLIHLPEIHETEPLLEKILISLGF